MKNIKIDLNSTRTSQQIAELKLTPDLSKFNKVQSEIYKKIGGEKARIEEIFFKYEIPDRFVIKNNQFFYFETGGKKFYNKISKFEVDTRGNNINLGVDLENLVDIKEKIYEPIENRKYQVHYEIYARLNSDRKQIDEDTFEITAIPVNKEFLILNNVLNLAQTNNITTAKIEHKVKEKSKEVFTFTFANPAELEFANPVSGTIRIDAEKNGVPISGEAIFLKGEFGQGREYEIRNLKKGDVHKVSLIIDFNNYKNPLKTELVKFKIFQRSPKIRNVENIMFEGEIEITPDSDKTELGFELICDEKNIAKDIHDFPTQEALELPTPITWSIGSTGNIEIAVIKFWNKASSNEPVGLVRIRNLEINFFMKDENGNIQKYNKWLSNDYSDVKYFELPNGSRDKKFAIHLPVKNIHKNLEDESSGYLEIKFNYEENQRAFQIDNSKSVNLKINFVIKRRVDKWLALDFGTSAIAAALYDPNEVTIQLLNLNTEHEKLLKKRGLAQFKFEEQNTEFLSSLMYLDFKTDSQETEEISILKENLLQFSPIDDTKIKKDFKNKVIPNLKMILGHDIIKFKSYPFLKIENNEEVFANGLPVNLILKQAYRNLFENYIIPAISSIYSNLEGYNLAIELYKTFGNIVITIPNTFNQMHENLLRELLLNYISWDLIKKTVNNKSPIFRKGSLFFKDKIKFVSESDAVACYYLEPRRWELFNEKRELGNRVKSGEEEYILIYDIGAGTTDISYLKAAYKNDEFLIESLANIGIIKAGNSLDTTIARIIDLKATVSELQNYINHLKLFSSNVQAIDKLVYFRDLVKKNLKLIISKLWNSNDQDIDFKEIEDEINQLIGAQTQIKDELQKIIYIDLFKQNPLLHDFVDQITLDLIENLIHISDSENIRDSKLKVDTVILSGRAIQFTPIKEKLKNVLLEKTTIRSEKDIIELPRDELKKAVVLGALQFVQFGESFSKKREVSAYYGILWQERPWGDNPYGFKLLLKPGDKLNTNNDKITYDYNDDDFKLDAGKININNSNKIMLIKSFHPNPEKDYLKAHSDMFTKILEIKKDEISATKNEVPVKLILDKNFTIKLKVGNKISEPTGINAFSLEQDLTYEENTWPFNNMVSLEKIQKELIEGIKTGKIQFDFGKPIVKKEIDEPIESEIIEEIKDESKFLERSEVSITQDAEQIKELEENVEIEEEKFDKESNDVLALRSEQECADEDEEENVISVINKKQDYTQKGDSKSETKKKRRPFI